MANPSRDPSEFEGIELQVDPGAVAWRRREPTGCGIPWPRGLLHDPSRLQLRDPSGIPVPLQVEVLDRWSDGSVRWALLDWQATLDGPASYRLAFATAEESASGVEDAVRAKRGEGGVTVETGAASFAIDADRGAPFLVVGTVEATDGARADAVRVDLRIEDESGTDYEPVIRNLDIERDGPVRATIHAAGTFNASGSVGSGAEPLVEFDLYLDFFAGSSTVRFSFTLRNPRRAEHPGGLWDLGDSGSIHLRDASIVASLAGAEGPSIVRASAEIGCDLEDFATPFELHQDSSGGENWRSSNHINRHREVALSFRGYRIRFAGDERMGLRATPLVELRRSSRQVALAMERFWENFPKVIGADDTTLSLHLFPRQCADTHELQGGEQKTHRFAFAFGSDEVTRDPLAWVRAPLLPRATPEWYCSTGAVPYLVPDKEDPNDDYLRLVGAAIEGDDTFIGKRETIDEYGWRHFGDIYGDHEAVYHKAPRPLVSHYNNQYDPMAGFAYHFLRSGDPRWWRMMDELARHVIDIDVYHTGRDKAAYGHGLFWHTFHYVDADTATHRSYPRAANVCGGGPSAEQSYATGMLHHYFLTGNPLARRTALELAQWILDVDDGSKTVFGWIDRSDTGLASSSGNPDYHGPGRGAGNAIGILIDGHRLSGEIRFLEKAEQLIRRCIHPEDDIAALDLLDAERRWFYNMFLQTIGKYLDYKAERRQLDRMYAYGRESLLHYARWMVDHEYPYLEKPEILEYPNETWAGQDMRKSTVFEFAAKHASGAERDRFIERAEFFFRYSTTTLSEMKTRTLCRPVVLMIGQGYMHAYFLKHPEEQAPAPSDPPNDFGRPTVFIPQKARAMKRAITLAAGLTVVAGATVVAGVTWLLTR